VPFADFGPEIVEAIERLFHLGYETWVAEQWIPAVPDIHQQLAQGGEAAEVGCGAGQCLLPVALAFPKSRFSGYDVDAHSLERAREKARHTGIGERLSFG
jgi:ubiquinone/menaquinone biosynthesis C-methylase UbiE